jgi:hypothetical protein
MATVRYALINLRLQPNRWVHSYSPAPLVDAGGSRNDYYCSRMLCETELLVPRSANLLVETPPSQEVTFKAAAPWLRLVEVLKMSSSEYVIVSSAQGEDS